MTEQERLESNRTKTFTCTFINQFGVRCGQPLNHYSEHSNGIMTAAQTEPSQWTDTETCPHVSLKRQNVASYHYYICGICQRKFREYEWDGKPTIIRTEPLAPITSNTSNIQTATDDCQPQCLWTSAHGRCNLKQGHPGPHKDYTVKIP
jgi:hypothetical protein